MLNRRELEEDNLRDFLCLIFVCLLTELASQLGSIVSESASDTEINGAIGDALATYNRGTRSMAVRWSVRVNS